MSKKLFRGIAMLLIAAMTLSLCACSMQYQEEVIKRASAIPQTKQEIFDYFCAAYANARAANVKVSYNYSKSAKSPECENSYIKDAFSTVAKLMTDSTGEESAYGEDCSALVPENKLTLADIKSVNIVDIDDPSSRSYRITFTLWEESNPAQDGSVYGKLYKITPKDSIMQEFKKAAQYMTAADYDAQYQVGQITAVISKETDRLTELYLDRSVDVSTEVTGQGTLASIGTVPLSFRFESTESYNFDWEKPKK